MAESFDIVFHGNNKSECTDFIRAVRKYAKQNKKIRDTKWIADELYDSFDGEALGWYVRLPLNVREDWELLQQALAARWIPEIDPPSSANVSSPACPPNSASSQSGQVGRIRIRANGKPEVRYLSRDVVRNGDPAGQNQSHRLGAFCATTDAALAMRVRFIVAGPGTHRLELVEHESKLPVAAAFTYNTNDWNGPCCWSVFVGVDGPGQGSLKDRRTTYQGSDGWKDHQFYTDRWQLESTGRLKLRELITAAESARFALGIQNGNKDFLWFCGPKTPLNSSVVEADFEFEPL